MSEFVGENNYVRNIECDQENSEMFGMKISISDTVLEDYESYSPVLLLSLLHKEDIYTEVNWIIIWNG